MPAGCMQSFLLSIVLYLFTMFFLSPQDECKKYTPVVSTLHTGAWPACGSFQHVFFEHVIKHASLVEDRPLSYYQFSLKSPDKLNYSDTSTKRKKIVKLKNKFFQKHSRMHPVGLKDERNSTRLLVASIRHSRVFIVMSKCSRLTKNNKS